MNEELSIEQVEEKVKGETQEIGARVAALRVTTAEEEKSAASLLRLVKDGVRAITAECEPACASAYRAHKEMVAHRDRLLAPWKTAEAAIKGAMGAYTEQIRQQRAIEQRQREAEERARMEAEATERAARLEAQGATEAAARVIETAIAAPVVVESLPAPLAPVGVSYVESWDFEILNAQDLARAFVVPDEAAIRRTVRVLEEAAVTACSIPGTQAIRVFKKTTVSSRR